MKIQIKGIEDAGNLEKERVIFEVLDDDNVGEYAVFKSKKTGEAQVSSATSATFWFTDHEIKKGDLIVLYTKKGSYKTQVNGSGNTSHFFYWNKTVPIWTNQQEDAIVLLNISEWAFNK
ncbi:MAG: hypothetical protein V1696_03810 [Candidatus Jorgensenbacteria bacterium]